MGSWRQRPQDQAPWKPASGKGWLFRSPWLSEWDISNHRYPISSTNSPKSHSKRFSGMLWHWLRDQVTQGLWPGGWLLNPNYTKDNSSEIRQVYQHLSVVSKGWWLTADWNRSPDPGRAAVVSFVSAKPEKAGTVATQGPGGKEDEVEEKVPWIL